MEAFTGRVDTVIQSIRIVLEKGREKNITHTERNRELPKLQPLAHLGSFSVSLPLVLRALMLVSQWATEEQ